MSRPTLKGSIAVNTSQKNMEDAIFPRHTRCLERHPPSPTEQLKLNSKKRRKGDGSCDMILPETQLNMEDKWNNVILRERFNDWWDHIKEECQKEYWTSCCSEVMKDAQKETVFPPNDRILYAFTSTPFSKLKVVILGQDPYHGDGQAMGLAFSVPRNVAHIPPSLINIYREIIHYDHSTGVQFSLTTKSRTPLPRPVHGDLTAWAAQGVFLLNTILTVRKGLPMSHKNYGWETFTDAVLDLINNKKEHIVFLLWGFSQWFRCKPAQRKADRINKERHCVLTAGHPSPLSIRHFRGCQHFEKANAYLKATGHDPIDWEKPWRETLGD